MGFYIPEQARHDDAVEVSPEVEAFLRECVIWGATGFDVKFDTAVVTYPPELFDYVTQYNAPTRYPDEPDIDWPEKPTK